MGMTANGYEVLFRRVRNVLKMIVVDEMAYGDLCYVSQDTKAPQEDDKVQFLRTQIS